MTDDEFIFNELRKALVEEGKVVSVDQIVKELIAVQPMPSVDFVELGKDPLWQSFAERHFK